MFNCFVLLIETFFTLKEHGNLIHECFINSIYLLFYCYYYLCCQLFNDKIFMIGIKSSRHPETKHQNL